MLTLGGFRALATHRPSIRGRSRVWSVIIIAGLLVYACVAGN